jgi:hypothetical protein
MAARVSSKDRGLSPFVVLVCLFAAGESAATCLPSRERRIQERCDDGGASSTPSASGKERQIPLAARSLAPPEASKSRTGVYVATMYLPGAASLSTIADGVDMATTLVDAGADELESLVAVCVRRCNLCGYVCELDRAAQRGRAAEVGKHHED